MEKGKIIGLTALGLAIAGTATFLAVPAITKQSWKDMLCPPAQEETQTPGDDVGENVSPILPDDGCVIPPEDEQIKEIKFENVSYDEVSNILKVEKPNIDCDFRIQQLNGTGENFEILKGEDLEIKLANIGVLKTGEYDLLYYANNEEKNLVSKINLMTIDHVDTRTEFPVELNIDKYGFLFIDSLETTIEAVNYEVYSGENLVHSGVFNAETSSGRNNRIIPPNFEVGTYSIKLSIPETIENLAYEKTFEVEWNQDQSLLDVMLNSNSSIMYEFEIEDVKYTGLLMAKKQSLNKQPCATNIQFHPTKYTVLDETLGVQYVDESQEKVNFGNIVSMSFDEETNKWTAEIDIDALSSEKKVEIQFEYVSDSDFKLTFKLSDGTEIVAQAYVYEA